MFSRDSELISSRESDWLLAPSSQSTLIRKRISTRSGIIFPGREEAFAAFTGDGTQYVCKEDRNGRYVRATEWICTLLGLQLGIATAACEILEDDDGVHSFFGSQYLESPASTFDVRDYLSRPTRDELGRPNSWLGRYLAQLYAFDLMIHNADRQAANFLLSGQRLLAIDFASARLDALTSDSFPIASGETVSVGRRLRLIHGFDLAASLEMTDRIAALPANVIEGIVKIMPEDWLPEDMRQGVMGLWQNGQLEQRLNALRSGLRDGTLL